MSPSQINALSNDLINHPDSPFTSRLPSVEAVAVFITSRLPARGPCPNKARLEEVEQQVTMLKQAIATFLVPHRDSLAACWIEHFIEVGAITVDAIGFVYPNIIVSTVCPRCGLVRDSDVSHCPACKPVGRSA